MSSGKVPSAAGFVSLCDWEGEHSRSHSTLILGLGWSGVSIMNPPGAFPQEWQPGPPCPGRLRSQSLQKGDLGAGKVPSSEC